jgi:hypothetical protein
MQPIAAARPASTLPLLLAHYVAGKMAQTQWDAFSATFDEADASDDDRAAFALFCLDATIAGEEVDLPKPSEWDDILAATKL